MQVYLESNSITVCIVPAMLLSREQAETIPQKDIKSAKGDLMLYSTADLAEACGCQRWFGAELIPTLQKGLTGSMAVYSRHCSLGRVHQGQPLRHSLLQAVVQQDMDAADRSDA